MKKTSSFTWTLRAVLTAASLLAFAGGWAAISHSANPASDSTAQAAVSAQVPSRSSSGARIQQAPAASQSFGLPRLRSRGS